MLQTATTSSATDWIQAGAAVITTIVSLILLRQLSLLKKQVALAKDELESGVKWNKLNAAFMYYNSDLVIQREKEAAEALEKAGVQFYRQNTPLTTEQLDAIHSDKVIFVSVRNFLNLIEDYCTAVRIGAIDEDAAFAMNSALIMRWYVLFEPLIDRRRVETGDAESLCELEKLAKDWTLKDERRTAEHRAELNVAAERVAARRGVQKKV